MKTKRACSNGSITPRRGFGIFVKRDLKSWMLILPSIILFYFIVWRPIAMGMYMSLYEMKGYTPIEFVGLDNYRRVLSDTLFVKTLWNTLKYVFWSLALGYLPPVIFAIMINEVVHFKKYLKFSIYFPSMIPAIATAMMWYLFYYPNTSGVLNMIITRLGGEVNVWLQNPDMTIIYIVVTMVWHGFGNTTIMYLAALQSVNQELYEAAVIDGAGLLRRIWTITIPKMKGVMLLFFVRQMIGVFQIIEQPLAMTGGGPNNASVTLGLQGYRYAFVDFKIDSALANNVTMFFILIVLTCFYFIAQRRVDAE